MSNGGFLYDNINGDATPVASTSGAGYSILDAVDGYPSTYHRSSGTSLTVTWDFGAPVAIVGAALINHNVPAGQTVVLEFSSNNFTDTHATEAWTEQAADMYITFEAKSYRYVRFNITVATGYIQVGEYCLYTTKFQFDKNYNWGYSRIRQLIRYQSESGGQITKTNISQRNGFRLQFNRVIEADLTSMFSVLKERNVLFVPDFSVQTCYHGAITDDRIDASVQYGTKHNYGIVFYENAVKI